MTRPDPHWPTWPLYLESPLRRLDAALRLSEVERGWAADSELRAPRAPAAPVDRPQPALRSIRRGLRA